MFNWGVWPTIGSKGLEEALLFFVVWLVEFTVGALVKAAILLPMS